MTFSEIKSLFEKVKANNPEAANLTLEEFAQMGARSTGDPEMARVGQASSWENLIRTANQKLNEGIAALTPDETLGNVTGSLAEMVGVDRAVGEQVGRSLPRQAINVAAMGVPGVGPALSFGLSAADTFDQTGSMWQTAIAGAAPMVVGKAMNVGGNAVLQAAAKSPAFQRLGVTGGREVVRDVTGEAAKFLPIGTKTVDTVIDQLPDKLVRFAGAELAGQATGLGLDVAAQGTDAVFNKDYLFSNLIGNLAFAPLNIGDFIGTKTLESGRLVLPPEPGPTRTPSEQRAFEFESLLSSLSPSEKTRAERAAGFDIAAQLLGERRLTQINKDFDDQLSKERTLLENDWVALQGKEPAVAGVKLEDAMADLEKLNIVAPESRERIERFQLKLKELDDVKKARLNELKSVGRTTDLLGVTLDELKLPESLLQKSADQREFTDYKAALDGKVSERGQQVIYAIHKLAAGKREDLLAGPHKEVAEEVEKVLQGKGTKFADDRAFVSMALWATGKRPLSDVQVKAKVEKKVKEGKTTKEAVTEVNQTELTKVDDALALKAGEEAQAKLLAKITPKRRGRPPGLAKATLDKIEKAEKRIETGLASADPAVKDFYLNLSNMISEVDEADQNIYSKVMAEVDRQVEMTFDKKLPADRAIEMIRTKLNQVKIAFKKDQIEKGKAADQNEEVITAAEASDVGSQEASLSVGLNELDTLRNELGLPELKNNTISDWALRILNRGLTKDILRPLLNEENQKLPVVIALIEELKKFASPAIFNEKGHLKVEYTEFFNFMHSMMKKETPNLQKSAVVEELKLMNASQQNKAWLLYQQWKKDGKPSVDSIVGMKFARADKAENELSYSAAHSLMSLDQWSNTLLRNEGFSPEEAQQLSEHFANAVEMFYSPEVRYGKMSEAKDNLLFARAPAGGGFEFGMAEFKDGKLLRPGKGAVTPRKDGTLSLQEFKVAGGQFGPLQDGEIEFYKQIVPEAFEGDRVNVKELWEKLNTLGEQVKVVTYGQANESNMSAESLARLNLRDNAQHQLETLGYTLDDDNLWTKNGKDVFDINEPNAVSLANIFYDNDEPGSPGSDLKAYETYGPVATQYYNNISPFDTKKFPVLRVDVVLPTDKQLWQQDNLHENLPNTLGWAMVQIVPDPKTGEKVMFVGEAQSRWGQERSRYLIVESTEKPGTFDVWYKKTRKNKRRVAFAQPSREEAQAYIDREAPPHSFLPIHQNLILKAVIKEAQKRGIKKVAISDGETAMMTEKHDQLKNQENVKSDLKEALAELGYKFQTAWPYNGPEQEYMISPSGERVPFTVYDVKSGKLKLLNDDANAVRIFKQLQRPSQEGGMRLAYDTTMPSIMKKLVGEGEMEDFGVHKNARKTDANFDERTRPIINVRENKKFFGASTFTLETTTNAPQQRNWVERGTFDSKAEAEAAGQQLVEQWDVRMKAALIPGSPVFRNPDGTPKTNVTARVYDISAPSERLSSLFARANISQTYAAAATRTRDIFFSPSALKGRNLILQQTSLLTHENSHILFSKARSGAFGPEAQRLTSDFETWAKTLNPHEAETFVDVLSDVWLGKEWKALPGVGDVLKNIRNERGDVDVEEVMANVFGAYAAGLSKPSNPTKFYTMMPRVVRDMFDWVARMMQGVVGAAKMYGKFGGDVSKVKQARKVKEVFDAVRRGARNAERNLADLAELANLRQSDVLDKVDVMYAKGRYGSTGEGKWKERLSYLFDNTIMRMGSLAATYDGLQDPFMKMKDFSPLNADLTAQVFSSLGMGKYGHTGLSVTKDGSWMRIRNSPELHKLASQINLESQMLNKNLVTKNADGSLAFSVADMSPELRSKFGMFQPEAQQAVAEYFVRRAEKANKIVQGVIVSKEWETQANKLHELLFESNYVDFSGQFEKSKLWSEKVMKMAQNGDDAGVAAELSKISDTVAQKQLSDYISAQSSKIRFLDEEYKKNPNFGSLRRFQPIKVKWIKPGEEAKNMQANTAEEAERMDAQLRAQGWTPQSVRITDFKAKGSDVFDSNTKLRVRDMEERVKLALKNMAVPEEFKAELEKEIDFVGMIERTENAQSVFSTKAQRRFAEGVEDLMVLEQDMLWMSKAIYAANRAALDSNVRVALKNPKLDDYLDAKKTFAQGYENFKTQNHDWLSKLSKANAAYFIGFNLPGHFAELMQPVMTHLAEMRYAGVKTQDALGIMLGASKDLVSFYKRNMKKFAKGEEVHLWDDWKNPEERDMLFRMKHAINASPLNYAYQDVGFEQQKLIEAAELGKKQSLMQAVGSPVSAYANIGLKFYGLFTRHNAIMGLLNGYRSYRKLGLSHEEAIEKTGLFETIVNKSGGKADRQAFPFKNNAVLGHLFYGLQGYTTGWISQLATYYRHGYKSDGYVGFKNNPEAIKRARNAFKTMLIAQFAAAGAMGMPLVGAMTTLLEEITGEDIKGEMYEALDQVTNDPLLSQAASHGLSTALAERLGIPADLHGRFAIGGLLGFNAYDGFSASSLLGPTAGMINSMWNLGKTFAEERDLQKALEAGGPTGLRSIAKALDEELPLRNENALSTAFGFNSTQTRKEREFTRIAQKRNEKAAREISHAARRVQEALSLGSSVAQQTLRNEAMKLAESPDQLESLIRSIGNKVKLFEEQRTLPKDIREVATPQTAAGLSELAKAMGVRLPASQEVDRELLKQDVMRRMGLSSASRVRQAMQADYLAEINPWSVR